MVLRRLAFVVVCGGLLLSAACSKREPAVDENLVNAFVETRVAELTYGNESPTGRIARTEALRKYGFTRETFVLRSKEVLDNPECWVPFQKAVVARLDTLLNQENKP